MRTNLVYLNATKARRRTGLWCSILDLPDDLIGLLATLFVIALVSLGALAYAVYVSQQAQAALAACGV